MDRNRRIEAIIRLLGLADDSKLRTIYFFVLAITKGGGGGENPAGV